MKRPTYHELSGKLKCAAEAAKAKRVVFVEPDPLLADLLDLNILIEDLDRVLSRIIAEIGPRHYKGKRPPEKSYEDKIKGCELYAFRWESKELGCIAYFKFALKNDSLWISSLHPDRPRKEGD